MRSPTLGLVHSYKGVQTAVRYEANRFQRDPRSGDSAPILEQEIYLLRKGAIRTIPAEESHSGVIPVTSWFPAPFWTDGYL
jgi:hypothetical protein